MRQHDSLTLSLQNQIILNKLVFEKIIFFLFFFPAVLALFIALLAFPAAFF